MKRISLITLILFVSFITGCMVNDQATPDNQGIEVRADRSCVRAGTKGYLCKQKLRYSEVCFLLDGFIVFKGYAYAVNIPCSVYDEETNKAKIIDNAKKTLKIMEEE